MGRFTRCGREPERYGGSSSVKKRVLRRAPVVCGLAEWSATLTMRVAKATLGRVRLQAKEDYNLAPLNAGELRVWHEITTAGGNHPDFRRLDPWEQAGAIRTHNRQDNRWAANRLLN